MQTPREPQDNKPPNQKIDRPSCKDEPVNTETAWDRNPEPVSDKKIAINLMSCGWGVINTIQESYRK